MKSKTHQCKRLIKQALFIVTTCFIFAISCRTKPKSTFVDIGTHTLHFNIIEGKGVPIIFESGGGDDAAIWESLATDLFLELGTTIITYDRAGYGNSEINPTLNELDKGYILNTSKDLESALVQLNFDKELIFVAHSYGGFTAALFSERNPESIKGMVLIDANLKCFFKDEIQEKFLALGTDSLLNSLKPLGMGLYHEAAAFNKTLELIQKTSFPDHIPIIDIVAERPLNSFDNLEDVEKWNLCHQEFSARNEIWVSYMAENSGHYVFLDDPKMVKEKIIALYKQVSLEKIMD